MTLWRRALVYGLVLWGVPFVVAVLSFSLRDDSRPLFESIMAVTVCATTVALAVSYLGRISKAFLRAGVLVGVLWLAISILLDAPLMLLGGPMQMTFGAYMADIGVTYFMIPTITVGMGILLRVQARARDTNE